MPIRLIAASGVSGATTTSATPAAVTSPPITARTIDDPERSTSTSRRAASGATRLAFNAGVRLATSVTAIPTTNEAMTVPWSSESADVGMPNPTASSKALRPLASPRPATSPMPDATMPTINDSTTTAVSTWRRDAPRARSSADSRVRWATTIDSVLWIVKVATSSATPANTSRNTSKKSRKSAAMSASSSAVSVAPVTASSPSGNIGEIAATS